MMIPCTTRNAGDDIKTALARYSESLHKYTQEVTLFFLQQAFSDGFSSVVDGSAAQGRA